MSQEIDFSGYNFHRPKTVSVSYFTDGEMVQFAASRTRIELDDGRKATLIRWTVPRKTASQIRVQFFNGNFATIKKNRVVAVEVEPIKQGTEQ